MATQMAPSIRLGDGLGDFIAFTSDAIVARSSRDDDDSRDGGSSGGKSGGQ